MSARDTVTVYELASVMIRHVDELDTGRRAPLPDSPQLVFSDPVDLASYEVAHKLQQLPYMIERVLPHGKRVALPLSAMSVPTCTPITWMPEMDQAAIPGSVWPLIDREQKKAKTVLASGQTRVTEILPMSPTMVRVLALTQQQGMASGWWPALVRSSSSAFAGQTARPSSAFAVGQTFRWSLQTAIDAKDREKASCILAGHVVWLGTMPACSEEKGAVPACSEEKGAVPACSEEKGAVPACSEEKKTGKLALSERNKSKPPIPSSASSSASIKPNPSTTPSTSTKQSLCPAFRLSIGAWDTMLRLPTATPLPLSLVEGAHVYLVFFE